MHQGQPERWRHHDRVRALGQPQQACRPVGWAAPVAHREQRADQAAHHRVAERVGLRGCHQHPVGVAHPVQPEQPADGGGALTAAAVRGVVVLAQQPRAGGTQGGQVKRPGPGQGVGPAQRIGPVGRVGDPVGVPAQQRGEPRVEPRRRRGQVAHPHVGGQHAVQPAQQGRLEPGPGIGRHVDVHDLPGGMHPRVGPPGRRQADVGAQDPGQRLLEHPLHRALLGLARPPGVPAAVVRQVKPQPHRHARPSPNARWHTWWSCDHEMCHLGENDRTTRPRTPRRPAGWPAWRSRRPPRPRRWRTTPRPRSGRSTGCPARGTASSRRCP